METSKSGTWTGGVLRIWSTLLLVPSSQILCKHKLWSVASESECNNVDLMGPEVHFPDNARASIMALTSPALYRLLNIPTRKTRTIS